MSKLVQAHRFMVSSPTALLLMSNPDINIRKAIDSDVSSLANFNRGIARETEGYDLKLEVITAGVTRFLERPEQGFYLVAEIDGSVIGSLMITTEWSDWRNGIFWWIQSVYVVTEYRRKGVYRSLYRHVKDLAAEEHDVCGFRLYVESENEIAKSTYRSLGMKKTVYQIFEELGSGVDFVDKA
jgi:ribosomal protein S18 acetylase RimI-like enzyme